MSSTITGLGSGFDINGWVSQLVAAKKSSLVSPLQSKLSTLQKQSSAVSSLKGKFDALKSSLQTFTNTLYDSSSDMWTNTTINSSNSAYAIATSSGNVASASVDIRIDQIATATVAKSDVSLGALSEETIKSTKFTNLANGQAKAGSFSMFLDGKEYNIEIGQNDTLEDVMKNIAKASDNKIQAKINNGVFSIGAYKEVEDDEGNKSYVEDKNATLSLGSSADESNIVSALKLYVEDGTSSFSSKYPVSTVNTKVAMTSEESGINGIKFFDENGEDATSGTITINGVDFDVDKDMSINTLISRINGNSDSHVKASYDALTNKIILTSTETGHNNISLTEKGTNLLQKLNLLEEVDGQEVIKKDSQKLGDNAIVRINGNDVISASNTITGESSGIANLSITVKKVTSEASGNDEDEEKINLTIEPDYSKVKEALNSFVKAYNDVVETTKSYTSSDGEIGHDATLTSILSNIRSFTSKISENNGAFSMLSDIGISTSKSDTLQLSIDDSKLSEALSKNFDSVKQLLSDGYVAKEDTGIFDSLYNNIASILDTENGYFSNKSTSLENQISSMNTRIERANTRVSTYETRITKQFNKMDSVISALTSQLSTFQSYLG